MTPEAKVKSSIVKYLSQLKAQREPIFHDVRQAGSFNYKEGMPDIWLLYYGVHVEVEVKALGGHQRAAQEKWQKIFTDSQVPCFCVDSVDKVKQIINTIKSFKKDEHLALFEKLKKLGLGGIYNAR